MDSNPLKSSRPVACWKNQFANWFSPYCFAVQSKPSNPPSPTKHKKSEPLPYREMGSDFCLYQGYIILSLCASGIIRGTPLAVFRIVAPSSTSL